jgi:hypothetical protein
MLQHRTSPTSQRGDFSVLNDNELEGLVSKGNVQQSAVNAEDADYQARVEAARATCRQRRLSTYFVLGIYLILIYLYLQRKGTVNASSTRINLKRLRIHTRQTSTAFLILYLALLSWVPLAVSLSTRRQVFRNAAAGLAAAVTASPLLLSPKTSFAACLSGDLRPECIGVYKVPMDDAVLPYVGSKEALKRFAPDLEYVPPIAPPNSLSTALEILETQQLAAKDIKDVVSAGRLEEAGIKVLNLIPKVTSSGRYILSTVQARTSSSSTVDELKISMLENQLNTMLGLFGECDVVIGQGLRGQMGVSAVAQLTILSSLRDASAALDDFLVTSHKLLDGT